MKEAIGGTWLFQIVILFIFLFSGYMCLTINYSKAFNVKDRIINEIERVGGIRYYSNAEKKDEVLNAISAYARKVGYRSTGSCNGYNYGCTIDGKCTSVNSNSSGNNYNFCISEEQADKNFRDAKPGEFIYVSYYKVKVFYQLDLPIFKETFQFNIKGDTKLLYDIKFEKK